MIGTGNRDRRIGADDHADQQRQRKPAQHFATENHHRQHREKHESIGDHRSRKRLIDRVVGDLVKRLAPVKTAILSDAIEHDDRVVNRKADERQQAPR